MIVAFHSVCAALMMFIGSIFSISTRYDFRTILQDLFLCALYQSNIA